MTASAPPTLPADPQAARLTAIVAADDALMAALRAARALRLTSWAVAAGAVRDRVWEAVLGPPAVPSTDRRDRDVDLVYLDESPWTADRDAALSRRLSHAMPGVRWEVVHQGHVHHWLSSRTGRPVARITTLADALAGWPETATAVGVTLRDDDRLDVLAPLGLADLFEGVLRRNPRCADAHAFDDRLAGKDWRQRWPSLRVVR